MNTQYSITSGSFLRNGDYPLEANYIFNSVEELKEFFEDQDNNGTLHDGLFKVVKTENGLTLYWCINKEFVPLLESESLTQLHEVLKDFELHGLLRELLRDIQNNYASKFKSIQQELDTTQSGVGLNGDGSFDTFSLKNTTYLDGAASVMEALKALDREMSNLVVDAFIQDAYYNPDTEEIIITFLTKLEKVKTVRISLHNLIREWEPDNSSPYKVVELTREEIHSGGADKLSADIRLSNNPNNVLSKDGNTLLAEVSTKKVLHEGLDLKTIIDKLNEKLKIKAGDGISVDDETQTVSIDEDLLKFINSLDWHFEE